MKLGFSTLGCPAWSVDEICENGQRFGFQGIDLRGIKGEFDLMKIEALKVDNRAATVGKFRDAGIAVVILGTSCKFTAPDVAERNQHLADGKAAIDLAHEIGAGMIRVFGGRIPDSVNTEEAHGWVVENLRMLADYGQPKGVIVAIETHDDFSDTIIVRDILDRADHANVRVLWDVHHPYRACGQGMQQCWDNLGRYVVHTHFKDSRIDPSERLGYKYCLMGEGDVPNLEALQILKDNKYDGYLSLEWEKAWHPYLADASVAFPQYAEKMREYLAQLKG